MVPRGRRAECCLHCGQGGKRMALRAWPPEVCLVATREVMQLAETEWLCEDCFKAGVDAPQFEQEVVRKRGWGYEVHPAGAKP